MDTQTKQLITALVKLIVTITVSDGWKRPIAKPEAAKPKPARKSRRRKTKGENGYPID